MRLRFFFSDEEALGLSNWLRSIMPTSLVPSSFLYLVSMNSGSGLEEVVDFSSSLFSTGLLDWDCSVLGAGSALGSFLGSVTGLSSSAFFCSLDSVAFFCSLPSVFFFCSLVSAAFFSFLFFFFLSGRILLLMASRSIMLMMFRPPTWVGSKAGFVSTGAGSAGVSASALDSGSVFSSTTGSVSASCIGVSSFLGTSTTGVSTGAGASGSSGVTAVSAGLLPLLSILEVL